MAKKMRKAAAKTKKSKPAAKKTAATAKSRRKAAKPGKPASPPAKKPAAKPVPKAPQSFSRKVAGALKAVLNTLTDAEQLHHRLEPDPTRDPDPE